MDLVNKPHVVCIPSPIQGHVKPMLILAKLLFRKGFYITFVNTNSIHESLLRSCGPHSLDGLPHFRFATISDHFPAAAPDEPGAVTTQRLSTPFRNLVAKLNDTATSKGPPVSCILSDGFTIFTVDVAQELGIPIALLFPVSACGVLALTLFESLRDKGFTPLKDESYLQNGYLDTVINWIPSMKDIRFKDLPNFIWTTDPNDVMLQYGIQIAQKARKASAIVLSSFSELEQGVLTELSSMFPRVHAIGPLHSLLNNLPDDDPSKSTGQSLWKEDMECLQWLDSKPPNSVLYVNFGSLVVLTPHQVLEFGWGLADSKHHFLWIIRPGLVIGDESALPPEFFTEIRDRGVVTSWCPQERVLAHPSVGGFLTHCGWNSTIESISAGVPMLCWPVFADQPTNCWFIRECGIGIEIESNVKRGQVGDVVREVMEGEKGMEMKRKVMELKRKAEEAIAENGSSSLALDELVHDLLLQKEKKQSC